MTRRIDQVRGERVTICFAHGAATADSLINKIYKIPTGKRFKLDRVSYVNPTGLAADNTNFFDISIKKGETATFTAKMAAWSTDGNGLGINGAAAEGSLGANVMVELTKSSAAADLTAGGTGETELALALDENGDTTLPTGYVVVEGWLI